jgi:hypothetical protein
MDHDLITAALLRLTALDSTSLKTVFVTANLPITLECVAYSWLGRVQIANS